MLEKMDLTLENLCIRTFIPEKDREALAAVHDPARHIELHLAGLDDAFLPLAVAAEREGLYDYKHLDVAEYKGSIVGFTAYDEEELAWCYVAPAFHRKGIGKRLVMHALEKEPGICEVEALEGNLPAKALYESCGFHLEKMLHGKMPGNERFPVSVYLLTREVR